MRDKSSPEVISYLEAENAYTVSIMKPTEELQAKLYAEMLSHIKETDESVPFHERGWYYYTRTVEGSQYAIHCRRKAVGEDYDDAQPEQVIDILRRKPGAIKGKKVLVLGLAFKPGTDDVRESASLKVVARLAAEGASVTAHDPIATGNFRAALGTDAGATNFVDDWRGQVAQSDIVILATAWPEYQGLTDHDLSGKVLFDARRAFRPSQFGGAEYLTIGRRIPAHA